MGFLDSVKGAANKAMEKAGQIKADAQQKMEEQKAQREALDAEMTAKVNELRNKALADIEAVGAGDAGILDALSEQELFSFTKDFAEKLFLPANTSSATNILIHPYITDKQMKALHAAFEFDENVDKPLLHFKAGGKQEVLLTKNNLYFKVMHPDSKKHTATGVIAASKVNELVFEETEGGFRFTCDGVALVEFNIDKRYKADFITLNNYFERIKSKNFEITGEEIHTLIREKVGSNICNMFEKYYTDDSERILFFGWGVNSFTASDFIICTNNQVIILDREMGGATMNARQLYYEDITSASVLQNSNSGSLAVDLINTAITASLDIADLLVNASGAAIRINNLYKKEAERIVAIYQQMRKQIKQSAQQPVQQAPAPAPAADPLEQLKKLNDLKAAGIITEEEFNAKKTELLAKL